MATRKKTAAAVDIQAPANAAPKPAFPTFSLLVTGMAVASQSRAELADPANRPLPAPSEIQRGAWAALCEPAALAPVALAIAGAGRVNMRRGIKGEPPKADDDFQSWLGASLAGLQEGGDLHVAAALQELAGDIRGLAASEHWSKAGAARAKALVSPASEEFLAFPALGLGLRPVKTAVEGRRGESLAGSTLARAGEFGVDPMSGGRWTDPGRIDAKTWLAPAGDAAAALAQEAARVEAAWQPSIRASYHREASPERMFDSFAALGTPSEAGPKLQSEQELPSVALVEALWRVERADLDALDFAIGSRSNRTLSMPGNGPIDKPRAQLAAEKAREAAIFLAGAGWSGALAAALASAPAPEMFGAERGLDRSRSGLMPPGGSLAQALIGTWDDQGSKGLPQLISLPFLARAADPSLPPERHGPIPRGEQPHPAKAAEDALAALDRLHAMEPAQARALAAEIAEGLIRAEVDLGRAGRGLSGMSGLLRAGDPRLGLMQFAMQALTARDRFSRSAKGLDPADKAKSPRYPTTEEPVPQGRPPKGPVLLALDEVMRAVGAARDAFMASTLAQAQKTQDAWLDARGLLPAWRQAAASGPLSAKSIGWAAMNPIEQAAQSAPGSDPLGRTAAVCARVMGLDAKKGPEALVAAFAAQMRELGAGEAGMAILRESEQARLAIEGMAKSMASANKPEARAAGEAMVFLARALEACAELGMSAAEAGDCLSAYSKLDLLHFGMGARFDSMGSSFGAALVADEAQAAFVASLAAGKRAGHAQMAAAFCRDWEQTSRAGEAMGLAPERCAELAGHRAKRLAAAFPHYAAIDWRAAPFAGKAAWEVLGLPSPRLTGAQADASARGGDVGAWCASNAEDLGVSDARDGNDLMARCREAVAKLLGMPEGGWKIAIKSPAMLAAIKRQIPCGEHGRDGGHSGLAPQAKLREAERRMI